MLSAPSQPSSPKTETMLHAKILIIEQDTSISFPIILIRNQSAGRMPIRNGSWENASHPIALSSSPTSPQTCPSQFGSQATQFDQFLPQPPEQKKKKPQTRAKEAQLPHSPIRPKRKRAQPSLAAAAAAARGHTTSRAKQNGAPFKRKRIRQFGSNDASPDAACDTYVSRPTFWRERWTQNNQITIA